MINCISRITKKYGNLIFILIGVLFILLGLTLQLRGVDSYESYNYRTNRTQNGPTFFTYIIGFIIILIAFKKEWIIKKKKRTRIKQAKILKLKPEINFKQDSEKEKSRDKVIKLNNDPILKVNKE